MKVVAATLKLVVTLIPFPSQLFSTILNSNDPPWVPTPAPALISPVGFSSTSISIIFWSNSDPSVIFVLTSPNIFLALSLAIDCWSFKLLNGSPSSSKSWALITDSSVTVLPITLIFSTNSFFPSKMLILISIVSFH